jgi:hypothetical protein
MLVVCFVGQRYVLWRQDGRGAVSDRVREIPSQHAIHQPTRSQPGNSRSVLGRSSGHAFRHHSHHIGRVAPPVYPKYNRQTTVVRRTQM